MGAMGRDVEVVSIGPDLYLVGACDSCGAIGDKIMDVVKAPPYIVGRFTARVALYELLAVGAQPKMLTVTVANEPIPTCDGILQGVNDELAFLGLLNCPVAVSSEKNMPTQQTGAGISAIGICDKKELRIGTSVQGDDFYCLGLPKLGPEVGSHDDSEIVTGPDIGKLLACTGVHDIIPVGSRGINEEAKSHATAAGWLFQACLTPGVDVFKSGGPATCLIFSCSPGTKLPDFSPRPLVKIGNIV